MPMQEATQQLVDAIYSNVFNNTNTLLKGAWNQVLSPLMDAEGAIDERYLNAIEDYMKGYGTGATDKLILSPPSLSNELVDYINDTFETDFGYGVFGKGEAEAAVEPTSASGADEDVTVEPTDEAEDEEGATVEPTGTSEAEDEASAAPAAGAETPVAVPSASTAGAETPAAKELPEARDPEQIKLNAIHSELAKLYIAFFNRAPDKGGLDFWTGEAMKGADDEGNIDPAVLHSIAERMVSSSEAEAVLPLNSVQGLINLFYVDVLGRTPAASGVWTNPEDPTHRDDGPAWWANQLSALLDSGMERSKAVAQITLGFLEAAEDELLLNNLVKVAVAYGEAEPTDDLVSVAGNEAEVLATARALEDIAKKADATTDLVKLIETSNAPTGEVSEVGHKDLTALFVAIFNRAPDAPGMAAWLGVANHHANADGSIPHSLLVTIATAFAESDEATTLPFDTPQELFRQIYINVLGRTPNAEGVVEASGDAGAKFWATEMTKLMQSENISAQEAFGRVVVDFVKQALSGNEILFSNLIDVADAYVAASDAPEAFGDGKEVLDFVRAQEAMHTDANASDSVVAALQDDTPANGTGEDPTTGEDPSNGTGDTPATGEAPIPGTGEDPTTGDDPATGGGPISLTHDLTRDRAEPLQIAEFIPGLDKLDLGVDPVVVKPFIGGGLDRLESGKAYQIEIDGEIAGKDFADEDFSELFGDSDNYLASTSIQLGGEAYLVVVGTDQAQVLKLTDFRDGRITKGKDVELLAVIAGQVSLTGEDFVRYPVEVKAKANVLSGREGPDVYALGYGYDTETIEHFESGIDLIDMGMGVTSLEDLSSGTTLKDGVVYSVTLPENINGADLSEGRYLNMLFTGVEIEAGARTYVIVNGLDQVQILEIYGTSYDDETLVIIEDPDCIDTYAVVKGTTTLGLEDFVRYPVPVEGNSSETESLSGSEGPDLFILGQDGGLDIIPDFEQGTDVIDLGIDVDRIISVPTLKKEMDEGQVYAMSLPYTAVQDLDFTQGEFKSMLFGGARLDREGSTFVLLHGKDATQILQISQDSEGQTSVAQIAELPGITSLGVEDFVGTGKSDLSREYAYPLDAWDYVYEGHDRAELFPIYREADREHYDIYGFELGVDQLVLENFTDILEFDKAAGLEGGKAYVAHKDYAIGLKDFTTGAEFTSLFGEGLDATTFQESEYGSAYLLIEGLDKTQILKVADAPYEGVPGMIEEGEVTLIAVVDGVSGLTEADFVAPHLV